jgi:D-3-phosphoglycerate dehydrogenase
MIQILNVEPDDFCEPARELLLGLGHLDECGLNPQQLLTRIANYDVLWVRLAQQIDRAVLQAGCRLRAIVTATTGLDHIDMDAARMLGIRVLSLRGETDFLARIPATAEHTWGLLLALNRHVPAAFRSVQEGGWDRYAFRGHDLKGQTLGIVGLGRLGKQVARFGLAFGMRVLAYDPYQKAWPSDVLQCESLETLLSQSQVLSLHVPLNNETVGMIGRKEIACLPPDAVLINTSRGEVLDSDALLCALREAQLRGAALDVIPDERCSDSSVRHCLLDYARQHNQLLITPHLGGATYESMAATEVFMAQKLARFLSEQSCGPGAACA